MSEDDHFFGSVSASPNRFGMLMDKATANQLPMYSDVFLYASEEDGVAETICNQASDQAVSYCTFEGNLDIDGEFTALFNIEDFYNIFGLVRGNGTMEIEFYGDEDSEIPAYYRIIGEIEGTVYAQSSEDDLEYVSRGVTKMFDEDENFVTSEGQVENQIVTDVSSVDRIIDAYNSDTFNLNHYPLAVENGAFYLSLSDENQRSSIEGRLAADEVVGPDMRNEYDEGFEHIFSSVNGRVEIQTEQGSALTVVKQSEEGGDIYRHMLMPLN